MNGNLESQPALNTGMMMTTWADSATANAMGATVIQYGEFGRTDRALYHGRTAPENDQVGANYTIAAEHLDNAHVYI